MSVTKEQMDSLRSLAADLREHAYRVAGDGPSGRNYDPETLGLETDAAKAIEGAVDRIEALEADALNAVASVRERYSEDVFSPPKPGCAVDLYSAAGARLACDAIARLLRGES